MRSLLGGLIILIAAILFTLTPTTPAFAQSSSQEAQVRFAHLSSDAPNVDVYLDGQPVGALQNVPYGTVSQYLPVPAGSHEVTVYAAGDTAKPVVDTTVNLASGQDYTIAAIGLVSDGTLTAKVYQDDNSAPPNGDARVRVIHAAPDAGAVDVIANGKVALVKGLTYPNASSYAAVPAGTYDISVNKAGTEKTAISVPGVSLSSGGVYTAFATGTAAGGNLKVILVQDSASGMTAMPNTGGPSVNAALAGLALICCGTGLFMLQRRVAVG